MATLFGTSPSIAAFFVAYRLSHLFRRIFAEGGLLNGFIPFYEEKRGQSQREGDLFFKNLLHTLSIVLIVLVLSSEAILALASIWWQSEILSMTMLLLPALLFICLYGLFSAYLQCQGRFFASGFAPVIFNATWIVGAYSFYQNERGIFYLCLSIVLGYLLQLLFVMRSARPYLAKIPGERLPLFSKAIKEMIFPFLTATIGVSATQINSALDTIFARIAHVEGPAYLTYAIRVEQIPLSFFAVAIAAAMLPTLSKAFAAGEQKQFKATLDHALSRALLFLIPSALGILFVGAPIINLIFAHGKFGHSSLIETIHCFWGYGLALIPSAIVILFASAFYAQKDYKTPTLYASLSIGCNIVLNALLVGPLQLGAYAISLSTAGCALINVWLLARKLPVGLPDILGKVLLASLLGALASLFSQIACSLPMYLPFMDSPSFSQALSMKFTGFAIPFFSFIAAFGGALLALRVEAIREFLPSFKKNLPAD